MMVALGVHREVDDKTDVMCDQDPSDSHQAAKFQREQEDDENSRVIAKAALERTEHFKRHAQCFHRQKEERLRRVGWNELELGAMLGRGGFNRIHEVSFKHNNSLVKVPHRLSSGKEVNNCSGHPQCDIKPMQKKQRQYVIKFLQPSIIDNRKKLKINAADLALEGTMLSSIDHPNIINIYAVADTCVSRAFSSSSAGYGYFLILERLYSTLDKMIKKWRKKDLQYRTFYYTSFNAFNFANAKRRDLLISRLKVAEGLASGMDYLHAHNIMYRDLKPENVGIGMDGTVKIFDFGFAKVDRLDDNCRFHTGRTGSPRYMAPEMASYQNYGLSVDVYSFGVLLWEILNLKQPFKGMTIKEYNDIVVHDGHRPKIDSSWSINLQNLVQQCWAGDPKSRLAFPAIRKALNQEIHSKGPSWGL